MTLQRREKILAGVVGVLLVLAVFYYGGLGALRGNSVRRAERDRLKAEVAKKQERVDKAEKTFRQITAWERQSLPSNRELAQASYYSWLMKLVDESKFRRPRVEPNEGRDVKGAYRAFPYTVRGQATLEQLVQFLYAFYSAGHLHQIRHLSMKPLENAKELDLVISIEGIMLPGADRQDKLSAEPGKRLAKSSVDEYRKLIVERNPFAPYKPSPPSDTKPPDTKPSEPERPKFDPSKYAFLTGITSKNGEPLAWIVSRTTDQTVQLKEGDPLEIGPLKGKVVRIGLRQIELQTDDGASVMLALGRSLREGGEGDKKPDGKPGPEAERPRPDGERRDGAPGGPGDGRPGESRYGKPGESRDGRSGEPRDDRADGSRGERRGESRGEGGSDDSRGYRKRR